MREPIMVQSSSIKHALRDNRCSIQLEGPVDMRTVPEIRRTLLGRAKKNEIREMDVDLSRVTVLDTAGVAMLVEIWRGLARRDGVLRLSGLSEKAKSLIQLARLDLIFEIGDDPAGRG
jgi:anti-sigma B factor antagonist